jgi:predicted aspartyl protease
MTPTVERRLSPGVAGAVRDAVSVPTSLDRERQGHGYVNARTRNGSGRMVLDGGAIEVVDRQWPREDDRLVTDRMPQNNVLGQ